MLLSVFHRNDSLYDSYCLVWLEFVCLQFCPRRQGENVVTFQKESSVNIEFDIYLLLRSRYSPKYGALIRVTLCYVFAQIPGVSNFCVLGHPDHDPYSIDSE